MTLEIGLISDTHDLLRPEALEALSGVSLILHAGDVCTPAVLEGLEALAPVRAVRGNNDRGAWAGELPAVRRLELGDLCLELVHDRADLQPDPAARGVDLVLFGHSHRPIAEERAGVLWFNPGAAGPRRFNLPVSVGRLSIQDGQPTLEHRWLLP